MPITKEKKAEYNAKFRAKQKEKLKNNETTDTESNKKSNSSDESNSSFFFQKMRDKIIETTIMASIPVGIKLIQMMLTRQPSHQPLPQLSQKSEEQPTDILSSISKPVSF